MKKKLQVTGLILVFISVLASCKKEELPKEVRTNGKSKLYGGDGVWDLLGFGLDVTDDMLAPNSKSDIPIIDVPRFFADFPTDRVTTTDTDYGYTVFSSGATATDYMRDYNEEKSFDINKVDGTIDRVNIDGSKRDGDPYNFTGSFKKNTTDQNMYKYSSRYSYASYENIKVVRRLQFTHLVSLELLSQYLTPGFLNDVTTLSAEALVQTYGTHVMLDINIGGVLKFDYSGIVTKETEKTKKVEDMTSGFSFGLGKLINIDLTTNKTQTELTEANNEIQNKVYFAKYFGGTNSGQTISIDKDGNTSQNINVTTFENSVTPTNAALVDVGRAVFIYEFITDPIKKAAVKTAVENHMASKQIEEIGEVPIYEYRGLNGDDHYFTPDNQPTIGNGGFVNQGVAFYAFNTQVPGTVPIWSHYSSYHTDHYFTPDSRQVIANRFQREGIAFYAYPSLNLNSIPVYVHYNSGKTDHYFTPNTSSLGSGWVLEGTAFYAAK